MSSTSPDEGDLADAKEALRAGMRDRRQGLHERELALRSARVMEEVVGTREWAEADVVGFYVSVGAEVETRRAIAAALGEKQVAAPRVDPDAGAMTFHELRDLDALQEGPLGIPEPRGEAVAADALDVVLVPGLAFDAQGNRVGRGGGYYDRFLPTCPAWSCGLAFRFQLREGVPAGPDDAAVDAVATEHGVERARPGRED
jgi:5-formyltetrahydrofolate cyclo-ligase